MSKLSRNEERIKKHMRIRSKLSLGTSTKPRITIFKSLKNFEAQVIDDEKRNTLSYSSTRVLKIKKGGNIEAAKKVGSDLGKKIIALGIKEIIFDRSGYIYHGKVKAFADAIREEGVKF